MKTLAYTTAFGEEHFFRLAEQMFRSLRLRGYSGDALLLCDRAPGFAPELGVETLVLEEMEKFPLLKARLAGLRDVSGYDRVLFVDSDVVFLRDPAPLFESASERLALSRDHYPLQRNTFNLTFFSPERRRDPALRNIRSVNTGVMVFPGERCGEYLSRWIDAWNAPEVRRKLARFPRKFAELRDQPVMQKLVTEGNLDCAYIDDDLLRMPLFFTENEPLHPETVLLHLNGSSRSESQKNRLLEVMLELNETDGYADFRRVCDRLQGSRRPASFPILP